MLKKMGLVLLFAAAIFAEIPSTPGWYEVPNTKIGPVCQGGPGTCATVITAWGGGAFDTKRNRMIVWGGGHNDYYGNEIYVVNFSGTPSAQRITEGCFSSTCFSEFCTADPTQPQSRHSYNSLQYLPGHDRLVNLGSPSWDGDNCGWLFSFGDASWNSTIPSAAAGCTNPTAYDPNTGKVFMFTGAYLYDGADLITYDFASNTYQGLGYLAYMGVYGLTAAVDPVRKQIVYVGYRGYDQVATAGAIDISGNGYTYETWTTTGDKTLEGVGFPGLDYDPVSDRVVGWGGGNTVYSLNLDTREWTAITYPNGPGAQPTYGTYGRWRYAPDLGVFVLVNGVSQNAYTFRMPSSTRTASAPRPSVRGRVPSRCVIYNVRGQIVRTVPGLVDPGRLSFAEYERGLASGLYIYRISNPHESYFIKRIKAGR